jgi:cellulose synthase/poly-beta-1,6-N-acetylglucosamine synthase-like glycosyltransferase
MSLGILLLLVSPLVLAGYAYAGYPLILAVWGLLRRRSELLSDPTAWPSISIVLCAYNEEATIGDTLEHLLRLDYPADRRQILVVSDGSTDRTPEIVAALADRGVELLSLSRRGGKTRAENAALPRLRGEIIVNTDASIRLPPGALQPLIARFSDPSVGVASGRDLSVAYAGEPTNGGESGYVGYEMWVRDLETRVAGIVGASGCFYAIRARLHAHALPEGLSRDFAASLVAREHGLRAVSVPEATCIVPRTPSLRREYHRKVRTMTRGLQTLAYKRHLLDPRRFGVFAWMLFSHKLCRWLVPVALASSALGLSVAGVSEPWARVALALLALTGVPAAVAWRRPHDRAMSRFLAWPAYFWLAVLAGLHAWANVTRGRVQPIWEPTRRDAIGA